MNSKKAMELSINFIVILILTIVTFGGGLMLAKNMFSSAGNIKDKISDQQEKQIEEMMLNNDALVALPINKKVMTAGAHDVVGLGINNVQTTGSGTAINFKVGLVFSNVQLKDSTSICNIPQVNGVILESTWVANSCGLYPKNYFPTFSGVPTVYSIKKNEQKVIDLPIVLPKDVKKGTYVFNVNVSYEETANVYKPYDTIQKLYVTVE